MLNFAPCSAWITCPVSENIAWGHWCILLFVFILPRQNQNGLKFRTISSQFPLNSNPPLLFPPCTSSMLWTTKLAIHGVSHNWKWLTFQTLTVVNHFLVYKLIFQFKINIFDKLLCKNVSDFSLTAKLLDAQDYIMTVGVEVRFCIRKIKNVWHVFWQQNNEILAAA